jgi:pilus assembly protein Flp/PilA
MVDRVVTSVRERFPEHEDGQGLVEYALIIALIAVVCIAGLIVLGPKIASMFTALGSSV